MFPNQFNNWDNNMMNNNMMNNNMMNNNMMNNNMMNNNMMNNNFQFNNIMNNNNINNNLNNWNNFNNNMNQVNLANINPMTFQLMLNFMLMMNPNMNINNQNNVNNMMANFMSNNPFIFQLFMNQQNNNMNFNNNNNNNKIDVLKETSEKIKNASKKGGILPRNGNNNNLNFNNNDPFPGIPGLRANIVFITGTGMKISITAPISVSLHDLFIAFIHKVNLDESVLGKYIYFLFNGGRLKINEKNTISNLGFKDGDFIIVIDTSNLLGGIN